MGQFSEGKEKGNSESELINELHFVPKLIKKYEKKKEKQRIHVKKTRKSRAEMRKRK